MIGVALLRRYSQNAFETFIVNPYHVSCYGRTVIEEKSYTQVNIGPISVDVAETWHQIAELITVATNIKRDDIPPDIFYVSATNIAQILDYIEKNRNIVKGRS